MPRRDRPVKNERREAIFMNELIFTGMKRRKKEFLNIFLVTLIVTFFMSGILMFQNILKAYILEKNRGGRCSERLISNLRELTPNLVGIWRNVRNFNIDEIVCDGKKAAASAMEYLYELGHKKIAYIGDCSYESRYVGYCESLIGRNLPLDYNLIVQTDQSEAAGYEAINRLAATGTATAVLCANDITALGALRAIKQLRIKNMSVISIDNIERSCTSDPMLTTMNIPKDDMAHMAVKILEDRIEGGHKEYLRIEFPCRIVIRDSCFYIQ